MKKFTIAIILSLVLVLGICLVACNTHTHQPPTNDDMQSTPDTPDVPDTPSQPEAPEIPEPETPVYETRLEEIRAIFTNAFKDSVQRTKPLDRTEDEINFNQIEEIINMNNLQKIEYKSIDSNFRGIIGDLEED